MEFIEYQFEREHLSGYAQLIRDVYAGQPLFAEGRVADMQRAFCQDNPFLRFGTWRSFLLRDKGQPAAHISAIIDSRLPPSIGLVGFFDSVNNSAFANEAFRLAIEFLAIKGVRFVRGPVDLTTWKGFRVSYPEHHPPFLLEPFTRGYYRDLFKDYGFTVAQNNISTIGPIDRTDFKKFEASYEELQKQGWAFERVEAKDLSGLLPRIWQISLETFKDSWSFVPVSAEEFLYNFGTSRNASLFVDIARKEQSKVIAFSLSAWDSYAGKRRRVIVKTLGALPGYQKSGVGRALLYMVHARAKQEGFDEVIFSTMRSDNGIARNLAGRALDTYREYAVFELKL